MTLVMRQAEQGQVVLAVTNHPRYPGEEIEQIFPLSKVGDESGKVDVSHVGAFPAKQVIGDWRETSHQVLSSMTQISWAGGGQIDESSESEDLDRYARIATLETRFPRHLMLLPLVVAVDGPNTTQPRVAGDFFHTAAQHTYVAWGTALREISGAFPDGLTVTGAFAMDDPIVAPGAVFDGSGTSKLYLPQGAAGYQAFTGAAVEAQISTIAPLAFLTHSRKLWALDLDGTLYKSLDGATGLEVVKLDPQYTPKGLVLFPDRFDVPTIHVVTDQGVFALDENVPALYLTDCKWGYHPSGGLASETWRGDLYASFGLGAFRYTGSTVNAVGLDRDDGPGLQGEITTLRGGFNDLFAGVSPLALGGGPLEEVVVDQGWEVYLGAQRDTAAVMRLTGGQSWHTLWVAPSSGGTITDLHVSAANDDSRVMWGWDGKLYVSRLTRDFDNPKHVPDTFFMANGELVSPWLDMNLHSDRKTLQAIETRAHEDTTAGDEYDIDYQIDDDDVSETWRALATIATPGLQKLRLGSNGQFPTTQAQQTRYDGVGFQRFRYRIRMRRHAEHREHSPTCQQLSAVYRPRMTRVRSFACTIDCSTPEHDSAWGLGNAERRALLKALIESEVNLPFLYEDEWVGVQMAYAQGPEGTGLDKTGDVSISLLEAWEQSG